MNQQGHEKIQFISVVVRSFYNEAKNDILIGYHFRNIPDFEDHIPRIIAFWEIQLLGKSSSKISPPFDVINVHVPLGIKKGELGRWIVLFKKSLSLQSEKYPQMNELELKWEERLDQFEKIFSRSFNF
jgi:hypothetical protein